MKKSDAPTKCGHTKIQEISRAQAKALGLKEYFTGVVCKHGHMAPRRTVDTACCECKRECVRDWYAREGKAYRHRKGLWNEKERRGRPPGDEMERFWSSVRKRSSGCWPWLGNKVDGYGVFFDRRKGNSVRAHRRMYEIKVGKIPEGLFVCHRCDNCGCVNPDHLFLGTALMNNADCAAKGRSARGQKNGAYTRPEMVRRGEDHGQAKLTEGDVRAIRAIHPRGHTTYEEVGRRFGCSGSNVSRIIQRKTWKHVA